MGVQSFFQLIRPFIKKRKRKKRKVTHSWSSTPVAAPPSNCCCCRMLSKSSILCSRFLMWAGRWQLRKHTGWPNMVILALTPPLFPLKWQERAKHAASKGPLMQTRFKIKQTSAYINQICAREQGRVVFFPQHSQHQKARQSAAAALTSKRRRLHQQQPGVMLTSTCTGRSHTDICTQACMHLLAGGSTHTLYLPLLPPVTWAHFNFCNIMNLSWFQSSTL